MKKEHFWLRRQFLTKLCPNQVFLDALSNYSICDLKWRPAKIVTLLPRLHKGRHLTLPSSESNKNIENRISMQENILWDKFCAFRGTRVIERPLRGVG